MSRQVSSSNRAAVLSSAPIVSSRSLYHQQQQHQQQQQQQQQSAGAASAAAGDSDEERRLLYCIQPHEFEIVFCLDNREHFGMGSVKQMLLPSLIRNHVKCEVRPLQVADFLWVARCKKTGQEAVLNILVERKRLDDLAQSMKDGRFKEQKFRLRRSGVSQLVLLVEDFGSGRGHVRMPEETLLQAVCNSQIIDNCVVRHTDSAHHTVTYLSVLTVQLSQLYLGKRLLVFNRPAAAAAAAAAASDAAAHCLVPPGAEEVQLVDFKEFNRLAVKSKKLSVQEMLAKHLLQLSGVTMEKAFAIVQRYPTVQALVGAYARCGSDAERQQLLADICYDELFDKRIGEAISRAVCANFCLRVHHSA